MRALVIGDDIRLRARRRRRFDAGRGLLPGGKNGGGCGCMKRAASVTRCRRIIISKPILMPILTARPHSGGRQDPLFHSAAGRTGGGWYL
jgi:hypothetical protein